MPAYRHPEIREVLKDKILRSNRGGDKGKWSARKAQLLASEYKKACEHEGLKAYNNQGKSASARHLEEWARPLGGFYKTTIASSSSSSSSSAREEENDDGEDSTVLLLPLQGVRLICIAKICDCCKATSSSRSRHRCWQVRRSSLKTPLGTACEDLALYDRLRRRNNRSPTRIILCLKGRQK